MTFRQTVASLFLIAALVPVASAQNEGHLFDHGFTMTQAHENVPGLNNLQPLLGQWTMETHTVWNDTTSTELPGEASVTFMNRGFGLMIRSHTNSYADDNPRDQMLFISKVPNQNTWAIGRADTYTRAMSIYTGELHGDSLVATTGSRYLGGMNFHLEKLTITHDDQGFSINLSRSQDFGKTWTSRETQTFTRATNTRYATNPSGFGQHYDRPLASTDFEFLIGEWNANHELTFPNGQTAKFPATTTAVHVMGGNAILEFSWYDVDPNFPTAGTSILRMYNPAMRRWESLYVNNRSNTMLHFGGRKDGEEIILHQFNATMADRPTPYYIFYDIQDDKYLWKAEQSRDGGETFSITWTIDITRK